MKKMDLSAFFSKKWALILIGCHGCLIQSVLFAAVQLQLQDTSLMVLKKNFQMALQPHASLLHSPADYLQLITQHTDHHQVTHSRLKQMYQGYEVFGGYAILHGDDLSHQRLPTVLRFMTGTVYLQLKTDLNDPPDNFLKQGDEALARLKAMYNKDDMVASEIQPMVYVDEQHHAYWAYKVSVLLQPPQKMPKRPSAILNAETLAPFVEWNDVKTLRSSVNGWGYGGNKKIGKHHFGKHLLPLVLLRDHQTEQCYMENSDIKIVDMHQATTPLFDAMMFSCPTKNTLSNSFFWTGYQADGYDRIHQGYSPSNDAMYAAMLTQSMYREWYNNELFTKNNKPKQLIVRVHYGKNVENAWWDGQSISVGDGHLTMYPLVSLDIIAHEMSHAFTQQHANLYYFGQSGGLNESFSDMAAQTMEYYAHGKNNWMMAWDVMHEDAPNQALRYMQQPSRDGHSLDNAADYYPNINVHYASGVFNRLFYLLSNQPSWNPRQAFHVMLKANMDYWTPYSTFDEAGCGILNATQDLRLPIDDVKTALDAVGVHYHTCVLSSQS